MPGPRKRLLQLTCLSHLLLRAAPAAALAGASLPSLRLGASSCGRACGALVYMGRAAALFGRLLWFPSRVAFVKADRRLSRQPTRRAHTDAHTNTGGLALLGGSSLRPARVAASARFVLSVGRKTYFYYLCCSMIWVGWWVSGCVRGNACGHACAWVHACASMHASINTCRHACIHP